MRALVSLLCALGLAPAAAQAQAAPVERIAPAVANPEDVKSPDASLAALYSVISGDKGVKRDWARAASLFHPDARFIPTSVDAAGKVQAHSISFEGYVQRAGPTLEGSGFHEIEIARKVERYGNIVQAWSTYEARRTLADPAPFMRGINSIQLLYDGQRYWILTIAWSPETPQTPIPAQYLPGAKP